jgi:hypothetical protein
MNGGSGGEATRMTRPMARSELSFSVIILGASSDDFRFFERIN